MSKVYNPDDQDWEDEVEKLEIEDMENAPQLTVVDVDFVNQVIADGEKALQEKMDGSKVLALVKRSLNTGVNLFKKIFGQ